MKRYNPKELEPKWQNYWQETGTYTADLKSNKPKYIAMSMFNYPSGILHVGHTMNYTISDVKARFKRQQGFESYHPVGWDAFGLPAENRAVKAGISPQESMAEIIPGYRKLYQKMGWSNDWEKEIATHHPEYYKWTQWIFTQMYKHKLAYQDTRMQWWCDQCQTVLANEQVDSHGKCWRHDGPDDPEIGKKEVKQWFFKVTEYADELLEATDALDWTESVKIAQKNWIGKSVGAEIKFRVQQSASPSGLTRGSSNKLDSPIKSENDNTKITVFTTRPDTLFGATFIVLAPEHDLAQKLATEENKATVATYIKESNKKTEVERQASKDKSGVFTGSYAVNPINNEPIPIWVADYVLAGYGTGAIMCVPAHDERDKEFADVHNITIKNVIDPVAVREDAADKKTDVKKHKVVAVVTDNQDNLLTINWGKLGGRLFIGGTMEDGEAPEATALREVTEETGYNDLEVQEVGQETFHYKYFAFSKNETHEIKTTFVKLKLKSDAQQSQNLDESEVGNFKVEWVNTQQAENEVVEPLHRYGFEKFMQKKSYHGEGVLANSGDYTGTSTYEAREKIVADLAKHGVAEEKVNYKMRDWSIGRQRYWGAPIPIIYCKKCGPVLVPDQDLPVELPELKDFQPSGDGRSALARATDWLNVACPDCGADAERETDTLDTYICSSWYMYRYFDPHNQEKIFDSEIVKKWEPIDFYNGGDHATAHLLYARFVARFFHKVGLIGNPEPFKQMLFNGKVRANDGTEFSKRKGNGVDPVEVIDSGYGADALRLYHMFAAPLEFNARWDSQGVPGTYRFLNRLWNITQEYSESSEGELSDTVAKQLQSVTHKMIKKVTEDVEENRYNTAIAALMQCLNELYKLKTELFGKSEVWQSALESVVACSAPFAPHITEELWQDLGHSNSVHKDSWPTWDEAHLTTDSIKVVVQVNGKVRATIEVLADSTEVQVLEAAQSDEKVATHIADQKIKKSIYVPGKLVNFVV